MSAKEAKARIKINKLLEDSGWRFFDSPKGKANIALEPNVKLTQTQVDAWGNDFETSSNGFIDFLLLDDKGFPLLVLEAKAESKSPLIGKEQARKYAKSQNCRFVILSNGNLHYFWDLAQGNPQIVTAFPAPESIKGYTQFKPDAQRLVTEDVPLDSIARTQLPAYDTEAGWKIEDQRPAFIQKNRLRFMRAYQQYATQSIQAAVKEDKTRFLFEMATGTGKTLTSVGTVLVAMYGGLKQIGRTGVLEIEAACNQAMTELLPSSRVDPYFLNTVLMAKRDYWKSVAISTRKDPNITKSDVLNFKLPLPDLPTQRAIVAEIEAEQALVNANRELIRRMEDKIKTAIDRVWGTPPMVA